MTAPARLLLLLGIAVTLSACGGGGGGPGPEETPFTLEVCDPGVVYGAEETEFTISGTGITSETGLAGVRFTAQTGAPFGNGTAESVEVEATVASATEIRGTLPPTFVDATVQATVAVDLPGLGETTLTGVVTFEPQFLTGFTPATVDGSRALPYVIAGVNLRPVGQTVTVTFTARDPARFYAGSNPAGSSLLTTTGSIVSSTAVQGAIPYAGVTADTIASVSLRLPSGASLTANDVTTFQPGTTGVRGTWTYEAPDSTTSGLDYGNVTESPVRRARVQLVEASTNVVITTRVLGEDGSYAIDYGMNDSVKVRVLAQTAAPTPLIQVEDNTSSNAIWASEGDPLQVLGVWQDRDYTVPLGWDGSAYTAERASGPFALLDAVYEATQDFLAVRTVVFPTCKVNWSPDNRPEDGSISNGQIGTSYYDPASKEFYILGKEDVDTDEFDTHIVVHEWGHFFEDNLARADSYGGLHVSGDRLDPTTAFSEGSCTALSALVLYPDTTYSDTYDPGQAAGWGVDVEANASDTTNPGWFSEDSVQWIVYDLFDSDAETWDAVALGLGAYYDAQAGRMKNTPSLTTLFAFVDACKDAYPASSAAINALCLHHQVSSVQDDWGTGEANNGGWSANLPVFHDTPMGTTGHSLSLDGRYRWNELYAVRLLTFQGTGGFVTVEAVTTAPSGPDSDHDVDLEVYENGVSKGYADAVWWGAESVRFRTTAASTYTIRISDLGDLNGTYTCTVNVLAQ